MTGERPDWLVVERRDAPLIVSIPHAGTDLSSSSRLSSSPWLARKDADWRLDELYDFVAPLGATLVRTRLSRSIIDVNRDPSGASLYPGQATTELVPTTTFDGEPLYRPGRAPDAAEIAERRRLYFDPYHAALAGEIARLRQKHKRVALFDAHSIRSNDSASVRRRAAGVQSRHEFRRKLRPPTARDGRRRAGGERANLHRRRALQGRLDHTRLWQAHAKASRPCSSNSPAAPICRSPSARRPRTGRRRSTTSAPRRPARRSSAFSRRSFGGRRLMIAMSSSLTVIASHGASKDARHSGRVMTKQSRERRAPFDLWIASSLRSSQ